MARYLQPYQGGSTRGLTPLALGFRSRDFTLRVIGEEEMKSDTALTEASQQYAAAHAAHYETKDLREALELYHGILAAHPDTEEAGYSRSQIRNIIKQVVPERELLEVQMGMAMAPVAFSRDGQQESRILDTPMREAGA